jgi:hypothetical protein
LGPFKADRLVGLLVDGKIDPEAMVCLSGETEWVAWSDVPELGGGGVVESDGVVVGDDVDDASDYMESLSFNDKEGGGSSSVEDDVVYTIRGVEKEPVASGSGIPLPKTVSKSKSKSKSKLKSASSGDDSVSPPTVTKAAAGSSELPVDGDSEWELDEDVEYGMDVFLDEEDVDVDAVGFVVEVSPWGLSERERRLMTAVAVWGFGLLGAFGVVSVTYWLARGD